MQFKRAIKKMSAKVTGKPYVASVEELTKMLFDVISAVNIQSAESLRVATEQRDNLKAQVTVAEKKVTEFEGLQTKLKAFNH